MCSFTFQRGTVSSQFPNWRLPAPRFPTQNHNRQALSKGDAKHETARIHNELRRPLREWPQSLLFFFQRGQKYPAAKTNFESPINPRCRARPRLLRKLLDKHHPPL
jgi:hypothetical protein